MSVGPCLQSRSGKGTRTSTQQTLRERPPSGVLEEIGGIHALKACEPTEVLCLCIRAFWGSGGQIQIIHQVLKGVHVPAGLRATGLADSPHSVEEEADSDRESGLPGVPQQISSRAALGPRAPDSYLGPCGWWGGANGEETLTDHHSTPSGHSLMHAVDHSPVWAALPGAGRSEELPGFAEVAGIDLASVAGLGGQEGSHRVRGAERVLWRRWGGHPG